MGEWAGVGRLGAPAPGSRLAAAASPPPHSLTPVEQVSGVESWAELSQILHETCEDSGVPELPTQGVMHLVLDLGGRQVPVSASTKLSALDRATALRVRIGVEDEVEEDEEAQEEAGGLGVGVVKRGRGRTAYGHLPEGEDGEDEPHKP